MGSGQRSAPTERAAAGGRALRRPRWFPTRAFPPLSLGLCELSADACGFVSLFRPVRLPSHVLKLSCEVPAMFRIAAAPEGLNSRPQACAFHAHVSRSETCRLTMPRLPGCPSVTPLSSLVGSTSVFLLKPAFFAVSQAVTYSHPAVPPQPCPRGRLYPLGW